MNDSHDLDTATRAFLEEIRGADAPTAADKERVRGKLLAMVAASGAAAAAGGSAASAATAGAAAGATTAAGAGTGVATTGMATTGAAAAGLASKGLFVMGTKIAIGLAAMGTATALMVTTPWAAEVQPIQAVAVGDADGPTTHSANGPRGHEAASARRQVPEPTAPPPLSETIYAGRERSEAAAEGVDSPRPLQDHSANMGQHGPGWEAAPSGERRSRARAASLMERAPDPAANEPTLTGELELLRAAQQARSSGNYSQSLDKLLQHERRYPDGALSAERDGTRILVLCDAGRKLESRELAEAFLRQHPTSPLRSRVRSACAP